MNNEITVRDIRNIPEPSGTYDEFLSNVVNATLKYENIEMPCTLGISIVDADEIKELNNEFRGIDSVTDVLSFPVVNLLDDSYEINAGDYENGRLILGDVVLCSERAKEQSESFGHSFGRELGYLTCHSVLHLIGYDHEIESERAIMRKKEEDIMNNLNLKREEIN